MALLENETRIAVKNMLWATDLSVSSRIAVPYVLGLARRNGARLYVIHVVKADSDDRFAPYENGDLFEERRRQAERMIVDLRSSGHLQDIRHLVLVREGQIVETLCRTIRDYEIDLTVIGTRDRAETKDLLFSPVAERLVRWAPCPVLAIGFRCVGGFGQNAELKNIICVTDLSPDSHAATDYSLSLARDHQAKLTILYLQGCVIAEDWDGRISLMEAFSIRGTEKRGQNQLADEFSSPAMRILAAAQERQADLIVLGTRRTALGERLPHVSAYAVMSKASCPLLTIPDGTAIEDGRLGNGERQRAA